MQSTHLRKEHTHGVLLGVAVGEALGLARRGLTRKAASRCFGVRPNFQFLPSVGIYGENTRLALLYAQALLNSRNEKSNLIPAFRRRLRWYPIGLPGRIGYSTSFASLRSWLFGFVSTGVASRDNGFATRALVSGVVMQGAGHRLLRWAEATTKMTHSSPVAIDCSRLLCLMASSACLNPNDIQAEQVLEQAIENAQVPELKQVLEQMREPLSSRRCPAKMAASLGWERRVPTNCLATSVMACYCWLRYPGDFERCVRSAILLGGDTAALGAIAGGLAGAHLGRDGIPDRRAKSLGGFPHGPRWIEAMADRFSHWPHGADDLHYAPAQVSRPLLQLFRNVALWPIGWLAMLRRMMARVRG